MEGFFGFSWKGDRTIDNSQLKSILDRHIVNPYSNNYIFSHKRFSLGIAYKKGSPPDILETSRYFLYASGRFDNIEFKQLFKKDELVLEYLFSMNLDSILEHIRGDFVLVLYDKKIQNLICVRDQLGMRPFYYIRDLQYFCFTNDIGLFKEIPGFSFNMDDQWIADSLSKVKSEKYRTPYKGIHRLIPGNILTIGNEVTTKPYWSLNSNKDYSELDFETATDLFSEKFSDAIIRRLGGSNIIGSELSGGLDSSGVTAYILKNWTSDKHSLYPLSHVLSEDGMHGGFHFQDESEFSNALVKDLNIKDHILCSGINAGILSTMKRSILNLGAPTQANFHLFSDILLEKAKQNGVDRLFSGFGGDEGVSSNAAGFFHELILLRQHDQFRDECQNYLARKGVGSFRSAFMCEGYYNLEPLIDIFMGFKTRRRMKAVMSALDVIDSQFYETMNIRKRVFDKYMFPKENTVKERQISQVLQNHVSHRLESSYLTARSYGIEYVYPLWDIDLLQFYLDLPIGFKYRDGKGRAIYRESLKGLVPEKIWKRDDKIGRTIPTARYRIVNDYCKIEELILRCKTNNRFHYLDYKALLCQLALNKEYTKGGKVNLYRMPGFLNAIQILLLQDMQRSGEFTSGIRV